MAGPASAKTLILVALAFLGGFGWFFHGRGTADDPTPPPLIRADSGPIKIRPKNPGGMTVPDQDKLIYQTLSGGFAEETVERLLPPPEEPLPPPEPPRPMVTEKPLVATAPEVQKTSAPPLPSAKIKPRAEVSSGGAVQPPKPSPPAAPEPAPPSVIGPYMVQLASLRSIADVDEAWRWAIKKNGDLLSAYSARVVRTDLGGDKGVFHRLRVGPFATRDDAKFFCARLKTRNVDCLVVRP